MCLSTVYKENSEDFLCRNIAKVENKGDEIIFTDIMGRRTVVKGIITDIDLMENIIKIREKTV